MDFFFQHFSFLLLPHERASGGYQKPAQGFYFKIDLSCWGAPPFFFHSSPLRQMFFFYFFFFCLTKKKPKQLIYTYAHQLLRGCIYILFSRQQQLFLVMKKKYLPIDVRRKHKTQQITKICDKFFCSPQK